MGLERGRAPTLEAWKGRGRLQFPCLTTALPMRTKLIHPRIPCRIITERVAPVLSDRICKEPFVRPLQKAEPEEFRLSRMLLCIFLLRIPENPGNAPEGPPPEDPKQSRRSPRRAGANRKTHAIR